MYYTVLFLKIANWSTWRTQVQGIAQNQNGQNTLKPTARQKAKNQNISKTNLTHAHMCTNTVHTLIYIHMYAHTCTWYYY